MNRHVSKTCPLIRQGYKPGSCRVEMGADFLPACEATLRFEDGRWQRLIASAHLSRPENYFS
ncbi:MAG TPA: hypothetical protein VES58_02195, partial [Syntrophobacteria bacterium]|nr:hypothetical protein [Syntrophobacteria bacterium]